MSIWSDIYKRGAGEVVRKEDYILDKEQFAEALKEEANRKGDLANILDGLKKKLKPFTLFNIEDDSNLLSSDEKLLLQAALILPFKLGKYYNSLEEVLTIQGVRVIIRPEKPVYEVPTGLNNAISDLEEELEVWIKKITGKTTTPISEINNLEDLKSDCHLENLEEKTKFFELIDLLKRLKDKKKRWINMPLLGLYLPEKKEIHLFPKNMAEERNKRLVSTLAHETMHAYFDRYPHNYFSYVRPVEEPLAEFGMLLYLKETNLLVYYNWAEKDVESKKTCYRYGVALMKQYDREINSSLNPSPTREDLESYRITI